MSFFFFFLLAVMFGGDLLWAIIVRRTFAGTGRIRFLRRALLTFIGLMALVLAATIVGRGFGIRFDALMPQVVNIAFFAWHFLGLGVGVIVGLPFLVKAAASRTLRWRRAAARIIVVDEPPAAALSRRAFLGRAAALAPAIVTAGATGVATVELNRFRVRALDVPIRGLPSGIDGMTIAHVSDVHLGRLTTAATFRSIVRATNDLDADLVLHTGDLINFDQRDLPVAAEMVHAMRGRRGQFMCEGNHDLIEGREPFERFARSARLPILIDQAAGVTVNGVELSILGLRWERATRGTSVEATLAPGVASLAARRPAGAFPILLAHHPHAFDAARASGIPLTLAGHTHGGQLHLSRNLGFGPLMYRYWSGLYERDGGSCVVSNGAGNWFPLRVNVPAEILHLTLRRA